MRRSCERDVCDGHAAGRGACSRSHRSIASLRACFAGGFLSDAGLERAGENVPSRAPSRAASMCSDWQVCRGLFVLEALSFAKRWSMLQ